MEKQVIRLDFTHVYDAQPFAADRRVVAVECADLDGADCYCDPDTEHTLRERLSPFHAKGIHFIDSGNYHYLTKLWTDKLEEPFTLVVFDQHPDMQLPAFGGLLSCGSWVREMLDTNPYLHTVCIVGASDALVREVEGEHGDRVVFSSGEPEEAAWLSFLGVGTEPVYVSVDKDVLGPEWAATNWDQGTMPLEMLMRMLEQLADVRSLLGADVCGEFRLEEDLGDGSRATLNNRANETLLKFFLEHIGA